MRLVDEHEDVALRLKIFGQFCFEFGDEDRFVVVERCLVIGAGEFVHQRADQPLGRLVQGVEQVGAACGAVNLLNDTGEDILNLFIEFGAIGDQQHPRIGLMLTNPSSKPHHRQALARALGVPDDAALAPGDPSLRGLHAKELVVTWTLLHPRIEDDEVVDQFQEAFLGTHLQQCLVKRTHLCRAGGRRFLPGKPILLRSLDDPITKQVLDLAIGLKEIVATADR